MSYNPDGEPVDLDEETIREGQIRTVLDHFFGHDGDSGLENAMEKTGQYRSLESMLNMAEGLGSPKYFARKVSERADEFFEDRNQFILLGEEDGILEVKAYADENIELVETSGHWETYHDIIYSEDFDLKGFGIVQEMPLPFKEDRYQLEIDPSYVKLRNGGVIGPGTGENHDVYGEFEPERKI